MPKKVNFSERVIRLPSRSKLSVTAATPYRLQLCTEGQLPIYLVPTIQNFSRWSALTIATSTDHLVENDCPVVSNSGGYYITGSESFSGSASAAKVLI